MKRKLFSVFAALLVVACLFSACQPAGPPSISADPAPLPAEEAARLQEELAPPGAPLVDMKATTVEEILDEGWFPVYAQVTGKEETLEKDFGGRGAFRIPLKILHDPSGHYKEGQKVALYANIIMRGLFPELKEGDTFVAPMMDCSDVHQDSKDILRVDIYNTGYYTITQDSHAIAAYTEYPEFQQNGVGLATLLKEYETLENTLFGS